MDAKSVMKTFLLLAISWTGKCDYPDPPEGYYAFVESPHSEPPKVRKPPYIQTDMGCQGVGSVHPHVSLENLCGDLNKGYIPKNPMEQNVLGSPYPFELIRNKTLDFFSKTLPILKEDETLPKVAKFQEPQHYNYQHPQHPGGPAYHHRTRRETKEEEKLPVEEEEADESNVTSRQARKFCDNGGGVFCMLYRAFRGQALAAGIGERRDEFSEQQQPEFRRGEGASINAVDSPPTPCPAKVEYATPVFAKNYQGIWRYVVQIPYEGYFTQTVEVTKCMQTKCHYMDGSCLSSPRWVSMLVAEIYYPDSYFPTTPRWPPRRPVATEKPPPVYDFQNYQQYLHKRAGENDGLTSTTPDPTQKPGYCDGIDEIGCFQVRLYYDWFLIPGSCKCWRPDYFSRYMRRKAAPSKK